jgi:hypothetical protein
VRGIRRAIHIEINSARLEFGELLNLVRERGAVQVMRHQEPSCAPVNQALCAHDLYVTLAVAAGHE